MVPRGASGRYEGSREAGGSDAAEGGDVGPNQAGLGPGRDLKRSADRGDAAGRRGPTPSAVTGLHPTRCRAAAGFPAFEWDERTRHAIG